ncbi:hypothetical protein TI39_contig357g00012 [Zymoseptoria brevis]|uniref:Uncharacterized protein n=1 Tax=Zymoseptoria brevis TaxID=1047168 RepID=A0A0F4GTD7_9PEZI|nr:hypothetical protein TI39_contig357g00012 [Zymoseptoria brevis]
MLFSDAARVLVASAALSHAQGTVNLGTAGSFGALAPAGVSNTGDTVINGDVGTTGTSVTGFPPGLYTGTLAVANEVAKQAQADSTAAFKQGQGLSPTQRFGALASLAGLTLRPGVYSFNFAVNLDGVLTLSGGGLYVIQIGSSLTTGSGSMVNLQDQADPCSVYWIVKSAATIGTTSAFAGNILAGTDITLNTAAEVQGGLYAGSAIVLDSDMQRYFDSTNFCIIDHAQQRYFNSTYFCIIDHAQQRYYLSIDVVCEAPFPSCQHFRLFQRFIDRLKSFIVYRHGLARHWQHPSWLSSTDDIYHGAECHLERSSPQRLYRIDDNHFSVRRM